MADDDRFKIYQQMLHKLCDAFGVPDVQTFDAAIAWIAHHYGPVGVPPDWDRSVPKILEDVVAPPDRYGIRRSLDGSWSWGKDQSTGSPELYSPPGNVARIEGGRLELHGPPSITIRNLLCLLAVYLGDLDPATLRGSGVDSYPDPTPGPSSLAYEFRLPIVWYFPHGRSIWRRGNDWETRSWSSSARNGGWWGYTWRRLAGGARYRRRSQWAQLSIRFFRRPRP